MKITEVRIHLMGEDRLKAFASVTFDDSFVVRNMKIVEGTKGVFLCMPSRKLPDGTHKDMVHPINQEFREYLEENILKAYEEELKNQSVGKAQAESSDYNKDVQ
ncbi:septation regulator SpoVG [Candidatus Avelusimicrobium stercoris]|uniref:septation regulator SpoVG n=2 Tax=Candidatus Avelusimicrobium stercoris TaxID=1947924 RepID=UPI003D0BD0CF